MNILENAKNHFRDKLSGDLQSVEVPEWGTDGTPAKLYFKPAINFQSQEKIIKLSEEGKKAEAVVQALIERALNEDGQRVSVSYTHLTLPTTPYV